MNFSLWEGRPNPVPNDEVNEKEALERYEREERQNKEGLRTIKVRREENDEDLDVIEELKFVFGGIRRRNRDIRPQRPDIFEEVIRKRRQAGLTSSSDD